MTSRQYPIPKNRNPREVTCCENRVHSEYVVHERLPDKLFAKGYLTEDSFILQK